MQDYKAGKLKAKDVNQIMEVIDEELLRLLKNLDNETQNKGEIPELMEASNIFANI